MPKDEYESIKGQITDHNVETTDEFYNSLFYKGYRPMIGWITALSLFIMFPFQIGLVIWNTIYGDMIINLPTTEINALAFPLVGLATTLLGIRTYEKVKGVRNVHDNDVL